MELKMKPWTGIRRYECRFAAIFGVLVILLTIGGARNPVGTGLFQFVDWVKDDHVCVKRFTQYWREGAPLLDEVVYRPIPDPTVRLTAIGIVGVPTYARLVRGQVLSVREWGFVQAATAVGGSDLRILIHHIFPNITAPIIVEAPLHIAAATLAEAGLSFLGPGAQLPTPSWGAMLNAGRGYLEIAPWMAMAPGAAIFLTVLGFNFLGDGMRDALDPRLRRRC
jgi:ABC-type dipeptide/oligopeptide/nickel transport system permease subunit